MVEAGRLNFLEFRKERAADSLDVLPHCEALSLKTKTRIALRFRANPVIRYEVAHTDADRLLGSSGLSNAKSDVFVIPTHPQWSLGSMSISLSII